MGDVAMLPHAIRALKEAYPEVKVTVATRKLFKPFFEGLDVGFLPVEKREYDGLKNIRDISRKMRTLGIDAFADTHGVWRTMFVRLWLWLHGLRTARIRKGRIEKWFRVGYCNSNAVPLKHTVVRYCDVFRRLGFDFPDPAPVVKQSRPNPMGEKSGTWIGFAPFSAHQGKTYPEGLREEVVKLLAAKYDRVFIHSGGGKEAEFAMAMESLYPNVTAVNGKVDGLGEEMNLISNLDCVVSMDSLVMHLASLVATPVVSVWGATHPELGFLGYGCSTDGVLQEEIKCRPCSTYGNKKCKFGDYRCIHAIKPQMIADKVEQLLYKK
jgi:ADP-heptose:LPS heptosyltransferase